MTSESKTVKVDVNDIKLRIVFYTEPSVLYRTVMEMLDFSIIKIYYRESFYWVVSKYYNDAINTINLKTITNNTPDGIINIPSPISIKIPINQPYSIRKQHLLDVIGVETVIVANSGVSVADVKTVDEDRNVAGVKLVVADYLNDLNQIYYSYSIIRLNLKEIYLVLPEIVSIISNIFGVNYLNIHKNGISYWVLHLPVIFEDVISRYALNNQNV